MAGIALALVCSVFLSLLHNVYGTLISKETSTESNNSSGLFLNSKGLSSNSSGLEQGPQWEWLSSEELPAYVQEEAYVLCLAHVPWCGLSRKLMRDVQQIVSAEPDRWPGLKLCKINGHKEPQLAASHGLLHQWPSVVFYLRGKASKYPAKLAAKPMLEGIEVLMNLPSEDVPVRMISSIAQWKEAIEKTEEVIVFYEQCALQEIVSKAIEGEEVRWSNETEAAKSVRMQMSDSGRRLERCASEQLCEVEPSLKVASGKLPEETGSQNIGHTFPAYSENPARQANTCPAFDKVPSASTISQSAYCVSKADSGPCSFEDRQRVDSLRLQIEDLAWKALLIPSKLVLLQVSDPAILEAALKVETNEPTEKAPQKRYVGRWVDSVLNSGVLSFGAQEASEPGLLQGLSSSLGSFVGRFGKKGQEVEESLQSITEGSSELVANEKVKALTSPVPETSGEGDEAISRISKLPSLLILQTGGRGPPKGFSHVSNLTTLLQTVPGPLVEEAKWDNIGGAFQENGPVVVLFLDLYSRVQKVREESWTALETLRTVGECLEGKVEERVGVAEKGSLLEGLSIQESEESDTEEESAEESAADNATSEKCPESLDALSQGEENKGSITERHETSTEVDPDACKVDERSEGQRKVVSDPNVEEGSMERKADGSSNGHEEESQKIKTAKLDGDAERPGYAKLKLPEASTSLGASKSEATESPSGKKGPETGQVVRTSAAGQSSELGSTDMQALLAHLSDKLKGLPAGSHVEIEVHDVSQQGNPSEAVLDKAPEAMSQDESQSQGQGGSKERQSEGEETGQLKYVYMDGEEALLRHLGVEVDLRYGLGVPALAVIDPRDGAFYLYPADQPLILESFENFLVSFRGGKLQPSIKSQRAPWLPPRLPRGSRVAFPVPSISAAALQSLLADDKISEGQKRGDLHRRETEAVESYSINTDELLVRRKFEHSEINEASHPSSFEDCRHADSKELLQPLEISSASGLSRSRGEHQQADAPPRRDILVLFTNNWCGFCQRAEVVLREVLRSLEIQAQSFGVRAGVDGVHTESLTPKAEGKESEVDSRAKRGGIRQDHPSVFRIDCDENDCNRASGQQINEYPALLVFPAKNASKPISYRGAFRVQDILTFLKQ